MPGVVFWHLAAVRLLNGVAYYKLSTCDKVQVRGYNGGMQCLNCGRDVAQKPKGPARRTCSARCRQAVSRSRRQQPLPASMVDGRRWARADGKRPVTPTGAPASSTNASTWSSFSEVQRGAGDGFGVMLGGGLGCYDLDNALEDGVLKPWARSVVDAIAEPIVYVERSVSGRGLHVFVEAAEARGIRRSIGDGSVEKYSYGRFIRCGEPASLKEVMGDARSTAEEERPA